MSAPQELSFWFPDTIEGEFGPDTEVRFPKFEEMGLESTGKVTEFDPPRVLAYTWGTSALRFELEPDGDGCRLTFTDTLPREESAKNAAGWDVCLENLEARLAGKAPGERSQDDWSKLHENYAARFEVDPEVGLRAMREYGKSA